MSNARFFFLYRYLLENTCEGHTAKGEDIRAQYENHEFGSDIRSVYRDIHQLNAPATGLEVLYDGRTKGYWLKTRLFSQSELQLIIDGIQSSKFITQAKARDLTQRIQKLTDAHTRAVLNRQAVVANRIRNMNESVLDETGHLYRAIREDKKVSFRHSGGLCREREQTVPQKPLRQGSKRRSLPLPCPSKNMSERLRRKQGNARF